MEASTKHEQVVVEFGLKRLRCRSQTSDRRHLSPSQSEAALWRVDRASSKRGDPRWTANASGLARPLPRRRSTIHSGAPRPHASNDEAVAGRFERRRWDVGLVVPSETDGPTGGDEAQLTLSGVCI